jgi:hypothetical protein
VPRREKRSAKRSGPGTSTVAVARTYPASPRRSTLTWGAGSTITGPSTAPSCASSPGASMSILFDGPCKSSNDLEASTSGQQNGCNGSTVTSLTFSPIGSLSRLLHAGLWGPDNGRLLRPVLREPGAAMPPATHPGRRAEACRKRPPDNDLEALCVGQGGHRAHTASVRFHLGEAPGRNAWPTGGIIGLFQDADAKERHGFTTNYGSMRPRARGAPP